jgi:hypothetical protein
VTERVIVALEAEIRRHNVYRGCTISLYTDSNRALAIRFHRLPTIERDQIIRVVDRTRGVSAAFIRELLRKAALFAAEEDGAGPLVVREGHLDEALHDLVIEGGELTKTLLGGAPSPAT